MALWDFFAKQDYHALRHYRFFSFQLAETKAVIKKPKKPAKEFLLVQKKEYALKKKTSDRSKIDLRQQAEANLSKRKNGKALSPRTEAETLRLLHELETHKIELEMQNEELLSSRAEMEAALRLYEFAPVSYFTLAHDGAIQQVNLTGASLLGVERDKLINRRFGLFVAEESRPIFNAFLGRVFDGDEEKQTCEVAFLKNKRNQIWARIEANRVELTLGKSGVCRAVAVDITERKQAEEALRASEERFHTLVESLNDVVYTLDAEQRHTGVYGEWVAKAGLTPEFFLGKTAQDLFGAEAALVHQAANESALAGKPTTYEWYSPSAEGVTHYQTVVSPLQNFQGEVIGVVGVGRDVTERKHAEEALRASEENFHKSLEFMPTPIALAKSNGDLFFLNKRFCDAYGYSLQDLPTLEKWFVLAYPDIEYRNFALNDWSKRVADALKYNIATIANEYLVTCKNGEVKTVEISAYFEKDFAIGLFHDVTARKQVETALRESEEKFRRLVATSFDAIVMLDHDGLTTLWNQSAAAMFGYTAEEMFGRDMHDLITSESARAAFHAAFVQFKETGACPILNAHIEASAIKKDGSQFPVEIAVAPLRLQGKWCAAATIRDVTERKRMEEILREQATRDPLTGLYNRRYLYETMERELARAKRENYPISVLMMDIDHFKNFNDTYGHQAGDEVLIALGRLLYNSVRQSDIACRYGGEEFIVIMPSVDIADAERRADAIRRAFSVLSINYDGAELSVSMSVGVACYPQHGDGINAIVKAADAALYAAKQAGRNCVCVWEAE